MNNNPKEWLTDLAVLAAKKINSETELNEVIKTKKHEYHVTRKVTEGELSLIYEGYFDENETRKKVIIKIIKTTEDNDLAVNEIRTLKTLNVKDDPNLIHLALLEDTFKTGKNQFGIVIEQFDGYNLNEVRNNELYKKGMPAYHAAWVLSRTLAVVGYAHTKGIIHCNIDPTHILIRPQNHNVGLIDWSYASRNNSPFKVLNEMYSPPEVKEKGTPLTSADLYSVGKCMIYLLGGNLEDNSMPEEVDVRLQRFIQNLLMPSPLQRARDAWEVLNKLAELRVEIWGTKKFVVFNW